MYERWHLWSHKLILPSHIWKILSLGKDGQKRKMLDCSANGLLHVHHILRLAQCRLCVTFIIRIKRQCVKGVYHLPTSSCDVFFSLHGFPLDRSFALPLVSCLLWLMSSVSIVWKMRCTPLFTGSLCCDSHARLQMSFRAQDMLLQYTFLQKLKKKLNGACSPAHFQTI